MKAILYVPAPGDPHGLLALAYAAHLPGQVEGPHVVLRLRPHDRALYRSLCDEASIVALVEYLCETGRIRWGVA